MPNERIRPALLFGFNRKRSEDEGVHKLVGSNLLSERGKAGKTAYGCGARLPLSTLQQIVMSEVSGLQIAIFCKGTAAQLFSPARIEGGITPLKNRLSD